jgi:hypothetical protein
MQLFIRHGPGVWDTLHGNGVHGVVVVMTVWVRRPGRPTRTSRSKYIPSNIVANDFPRQCIATIICHGNSVVSIEGHDRVYETVNQGSSSFKSFMLANKEYNWIQNVSTTDSEVFDIAADIQGEQGMVVSDGSFKENRGTAAVVIEGTNSKARILADVVVPGDGSYQCAFRSEAAGILAAMQLVNAVARYTGIPSGKVKMCCDGKSALSRCFSNKVDTNLAHWDVINLAIRERKDSIITWQQHHVKGHQDTFPLERDAALNDEMDQRCKKFWVEGPVTAQWFLQPWTVTVNNRQVTSELAETIRSLCADIRVTTYWERKLGTKKEEIDWKTLGYALGTVPRNRAQWLTKNMSGFNSVGSFAKKIGLRSTDECPQCGEPETTEHVWRCLHPEATKLWNAQMGDLRKLLRHLQTDPSIAKVIIEGLNGWRKGEEKIYNSRFSGEQAADLQSGIGWKHFFEGRLHTQWRLVQEQYFHLLAIRRSGKRWSGAIIKKLWDIAWDLWEHRNGILHGKDCALLSIEIDKQITKLWEDPDRTKIQSLRNLAKTSLNAVLQSSLNMKQHWVIRVNTALTRFKENQDDFKFASEREQMRRYLRLYNKE